MSPKSTAVRIEESAWSLPLVLGLVDSGWLDLSASVVLLLLNLAMQLAFSAILLSEEFMGEAFGEKLRSAQAA